MRTVTYSLQQLLSEARRSAYVIPRFQRDFVWKGSQVKLLVDSIAHNYPIGSLLLLNESKPSDPFLASRGIDVILRESEAQPDGSPPTAEKSAAAMQYVLDGQQRLTTLVRVFLQSSPNGNYYFDLKKLLQLEHAERTAPDWIVKRASNATVPKRYLRSNDVMEQEKCQVFVDEYFEQNEESLRNNRPAQRRASAKVNRIFETIRNYQIPLVIIDGSESTEAICRIFETINSTGTRLTTFDLAVARFFPKPDLHRLWIECQETHPILKKFGAEGERVLQLIALQVAAAGQTYLEVTRGTLLALKREEIESRWAAAARALADAYKWVEGRGAVSELLADERLLVPIAFFLSSINDRWKHENPGFATHLERWYFANALQQGARTASNYRVSQVSGELRTWVTEGKRPTLPKVTLSARKLLDLTKSDTRYRAIHALLRQKCDRDLWTGEKLDLIEIEDHHIFPASLAKRKDIDRRLLDSVANRLFVSKQTNRRLGDRPPADYMTELWFDARESGAATEQRKWLDAACIPIPEGSNDMTSLFDPSRAEWFLTARANLIIKMLRNLLGDVLDTGAPESVGPEEDDDD